MATIMIRDLTESKVLAETAMSHIVGGRASLFWMPTSESLRFRNRQSGLGGGMTRPLTIVYQNITQNNHIVNVFNKYDFDVTASYINIDLGLGQIDTE
jgi:hypothetical protein